MIGLPAFKNPSGPHWVARAVPGMQQVDARGELWVLVAKKNGGRVLEWKSHPDARKAATEVTPDHPEYPSDAVVLDWERAERRRAAEDARNTFY